MKSKTTSRITIGRLASLVKRKTSLPRRCNCCGQRFLQGEVERPGNTSLRTLGVLRDLDRSTAVTFQKLCSTIVSIRPDGNAFLDARIPSLGGDAAHNALKSHGLGFSSLNVLNEHGLIISDYNSWSDYRVCIGVEHERPSRILRIPLWFQNRYWILESTSAGRRDGEFRVYGVCSNSGGPRAVTRCRLVAHARVRPRTS